LSLENNVRAWLDSQGYPLEMRVADVLRNANAPWDHSRVYDDPLTSKVREIDLMGYLDYRKPVKFSVHLVIECKHSRGKPWVLFCTKQMMLSPIGYVLSLPSTEEAKHRISFLATSKEVQGMPLFQAPELIGFNFVRAHTDNQDAAFHAVRGVTTAAVSVAKKISEYGHAVLYVPIVVIDSPLMQCYLPEKSDAVSLEEIKSGSLIYNTGTEHVMVRILHINALPQFIETIKRDGTALHAKLREIVEGNEDTP
jgi:hypothetical protein